MNIAQRVEEIRAKIGVAAREVGRAPEDILFLAATKTQSGERVRETIAAGVTACGENRVQELTDKLSQYAYDNAQLHFIGHLQTNKVKQVVGRVDLIESVDSLRLLNAIHQQAEKMNIVQDILLEVNIGREANKHGALPEEILDLAQHSQRLPHVRLRGLMCIPPVVDGIEGNRPFFRETRQLFVDIRDKIEDNTRSIDCLSMGMSDDYEDAVREGATVVRLGTALYGARTPIV